MLPIPGRRASFVAVLCLASSCIAFAEAPVPPLQVISDDNYPPYVFRDSSGKLQGIVVDQWREWARATGRRVDLIGLDWSEAQRRMQAGEADVIDTMFDTPERRVLYDFGPPYVRIESSVFFHRTIGGLVTLSDLKGFHVAVKSGDALIGVLMANGVNDFEEYPSYEAIVSAAAKGEVRVFCIDRPPALYFLNKLGIERDFRSSISIPGGEFHRAVRKGRADLLTVLSMGFDAIPGSAYAAIDRKWLGTTLPTLLDLRIVGIVVASVLCLVLFLLIAAARLRRRIAEATTELRQRLGELETSQAKNRAFIAALPDLFFTFDREGRYLECTTAAKELLIAPPEDFLGKLIPEVITEPGLAERYLDCIHASLGENRLVVMEYELKVPAGLMRFEGRFVPLDSERVILVARDVTEARRREELLKASLVEKKESEVTLRRSEQRYRDLLEKAVDGIFLLDKNGNFLMVNSKICEMLGYSREELLRMSILDTYPEESQYEGRDRIERVESGENLRFERLMRRKDGAVFPVEISAGKLLDGTQQAFARDITMRRQAEELLRDSLAEKEVLLREIHHRVKNNLQVISSLVSLQESSCRDEAERGLNRDTQVRIRSMAHLHELLYGSKDLSSIDPGEFLKAIAGEISGYYGKYSVRVEAGPDILSVDEAMPFGLIATELLTNVFKYAYPADNAGDIIVSYIRSGMERRLEVRDYGVGLPPDFDPISSASLGFTLVHSLAVQLGGSIAIYEANPGEPSPGLGVVLTFPAPPPRKM